MTGWPRPRPPGLAFACDSNAKPTRKETCQPTNGRAVPTVSCERTWLECRYEPRKPADETLNPRHFMKLGKPPMLNESIAKLGGTHSALGLVAPSGSWPAWTALCVA